MRAAIRRLFRRRPDGHLRAGDSSDPQEYIDTQRAHVDEYGEEVNGHEIGRSPHA